MSLILDALRKSEAERRKAQATADVLASPAHPPATLLAGVPTWAWPAGGLLLLVVIAIWAMARAPSGNVIEAGQPNQRNAVAAEAASPVAETSGGSTSHDISPDIAPDTWHDPSTNPSADSTPTPTPTAPSAQPGPRVASAMQGPIPNASSGPLPAAAVAAAVAAAAAAPAPAPAASAVASTSPKPSFPTSPSANAPTVTAKATTALSMPPSPAVTPIANGSVPPAPTAPSPAAATSTVATAPTTRRAPTDDPIRLSDLGTADRQQLPPLKMSMHMWGPDADKRFAIIDGTRIGEGDRVGEAVVESIDQNGVVLAWNGYRLRVPVR